MIHFLIVCAILGAMVWIGGLVVTMGLYIVIGIPALIIGLCVKLWHWINSGEWEQ